MMYLEYSENSRARNRTGQTSCYILPLEEDQLQKFPSSGSPRTSKAQAKVRVQVLLPLSLHKA